MNFRLKVASMAALGTFSLAVVSGVSMADDSLPALPVLEPVKSLSSDGKPGAAQGDTPVVFAVLKEVVQPAPTAGNQTRLPSDHADNGTDLSEKDYISLASMVNDTDVDATLDEETRCLATAVFYESRSESLEGQLAVARVIVNRAESSRFGASMCDVVRQPGQFSFVRGGVIPFPSTAKPAWKTSVAIAQIAQDNAWASKAEGALYFHARRVSPGWRRTRVAVIDNHIFYR